MRPRGGTEKGVHERGRVLGDIARLFCLIILVANSLRPLTATAQSDDEPLLPPLSRGEEDIRLTQALDTLSKITKKRVRRLSIWEALAGEQLRVGPDEIVALDVPASLEAREMSSGLSIRDYITFHALLESGLHYSGQMVMIPKTPGTVPHLEAESGGEYAVTKEGSLYLIPDNLDPFSMPERFLTLPPALVARIPSKPQEKSGDILGFYKFVDWYGLVLARGPLSGSSYNRPPDMIYSFSFGSERAPLGDLFVSLEAPIPPTPTPITITVQPAGSIVSGRGRSAPFVQLSISPIEERVKAQLYGDENCKQVVSDIVVSNAIGAQGIQASRLPVNEETQIFARGFDDFGSSSACVHVATYTIDLVAPKIERLTALTAGPVVTTGANILITTHFTEVVEVDKNSTNSLSIKLNTGGVARYVSGSGSPKLEFKYTVGPESVDVAALELAPSGLGPGVGDSVGNPASAAAPIQGPGILASGRSIRVAITPPLPPKNASTLSKNGGGSVVFTWQPFDGAAKLARPSSWVVESATSKQGPYAEILSGSITESTSLGSAFIVEVPNLINGSNYYLRVRFDNGPVKGAYNPGLLTLAPRARPSAPDSLVASYLFGQVTLSVNRALKPVVGPTTFVFESRKEGEDRWRGTVIRDTGSVFVDTAQAWTQPPGSILHYRAKAVNANGESSDWSGEATVVVPQSLSAKGVLTIDCLGYQSIAITIPDRQKVLKVEILNAVSKKLAPGVWIQQGTATPTFKLAEGVPERGLRSYIVKTVTSDKQELLSEAIFGVAPACPIPEPKTLSVSPSIAKSNPPAVKVSFVPDPSCSYRVDMFEGRMKISPRTQAINISQALYFFPGRLGSSYTVVVTVTRRGRSAEFKRQITLPPAR